MNYSRHSNFVHSRPRSRCTSRLAALLLLGLAISNAPVSDAANPSGGAPPFVQTPPQTQTAEQGAAVPLCVAAVGTGPLTYQWFFNVTNALSAMTTNPCYDLANAQPSDSGAYSVVVTNLFGSATSTPGLLNVIPPVQRRPVGGVQVTAASGNLLTVDCMDFLSSTSVWTTLGSVSLTNMSGYYFDVTAPLPPQRFYRAWQTGALAVVPSLNVHIIPAVTVTGNIGNLVRVDAINRFGPTDAWFTVDTVTLADTSQLYFDLSAAGQPERLYRLTPVP